MTGIHGLAGIPSSGGCPAGVHHRNRDARRRDSGSAHWCRSWPASTPSAVHLLEFAHVRAPFGHGPAPSPSSPSDLHLGASPWALNAAPFPSPARPAGAAAAPCGGHPLPPPRRRPSLRRDRRRRTPAAGVLRRAGGAAGAPWRPRGWRRGSPMGCSTPKTCRWSARELRRRPLRLSSTLASGVHRLRLRPLRPLRLWPTAPDLPAQPAAAAGTAGDAAAAS